MFVQVFFFFFFKSTAYHGIVLRKHFIRLAGCVRPGNPLKISPFLEKKKVKKNGLVNVPPPFCECLLCCTPLLCGLIGRMRFEEDVCESMR